MSHCHRYWRMLSALLGPCILCVVWMVGLLQFASSIANVENQQQQQSTNPIVVLTLIVSAIHSMGIVQIQAQLDELTPSHRERDDGATFALCSLYLFVVGFASLFVVLPEPEDVVNNVCNTATVALFVYALSPVPLFCAHTHGAFVLERAKHIRSGATLVPRGGHQQNKCGDGEGVGGLWMPQYSRQIAWLSQQVENIGFDGERHAHRARGDVCIEEVDADGAYVRVRNTGGAHVSIGGWTIRSSAKSLVNTCSPGAFPLAFTELYDVEFKFPPKTTIEAGETITIWSSGKSPPPATQSSKHFELVPKRLSLMPCALGLLDSWPVHFSKRIVLDNGFAVVAWRSVFSPKELVAAWDVFYDFDGFWRNGFAECSYFMKGHLPPSSSGGCNVM